MRNGRAAEAHRGMLDVSPASKCETNETGFDDGRLLQRATQCSGSSAAAAESFLDQVSIDMDVMDSLLLTG